MKIDDWKVFQKNNPTISLHILYIKEKEIFPAYISKFNSNCEKKITKKQIILLMTQNEEKESHEKSHEKVRIKISLEL